MPRLQNQLNETRKTELPAANLRAAFRKRLGMRRAPFALKTALLALMLGALSLAQVSSEFVTPDIRRVGTRLACLCGSCKNSVGDCPMLACHYSNPAREKINQMQSTGKPDEAIVASFVKQEGIRALVTPPSEGFNVLAWWMIPIMVGLGLALIWWFIARMRKPGPPLPEIDPKLLARYQASIEKDLAKLD